MGQEEKEQYPWMTALQDERDKIIRNHQNRAIQFENSSLELTFGCGLMLIGSGFLASGFLGYFGSIEVGQMTGLLPGVLLIYAGFLFLLSHGYDYGTLSAFETVIASAKSKKDVNAAWLKQTTLTEMRAAARPVFGSGILANILGLILVIYGLYVTDLLLLQRLGTKPQTMLAGFVIVLVSLSGGLSFFLIKEPFKRARIKGFQSCLEIIHLSEHAPKPKEEKGLLEEDDEPAPPTAPETEERPKQGSILPDKELEGIELHNFDPDDIDITGKDES